MKRSAQLLQPGERVALPNSGAPVVVISNERGATWAERECDGMPCLLDRLKMYPVACISAEGSSWAMEEAHGRHT